MEIGFDKDFYMKKQSQFILERIEKFDKLYLEFGGKLLEDFHAGRVLPGFDVNAKIKLLEKLKDKAEIIIPISAKDLERNKIRADYGINYGLTVFHLIDNLRERKISVNSVVITQFENQPAAEIYKQKLEHLGIKVYLHTKTKGYPTDIETIISDEGYGKNEYIETTKPLVVVTAPGPGSGKLATCMCQLYHEYKRGVKAGYAKFETFPIWNLPLKHPVNVAYEAATADLKDVNMIDHFHLEAYGKTCVNYNRDIEVFPVVRAIMKKLSNGDLVYQSPTDMGVNMAGFAITDDEIVRKAACKEVIRRYYKALCDCKQGLCDNSVPEKIEFLMGELNISVNDRPVVAAALEKSKKEMLPVTAIQLPDGKIITGKASELMTASCSMLLNAIKSLAGISDGIKLISPLVINPILKLKKNILKQKDRVLNLEQVLIALSICAATNPAVEAALSKLGELEGLEAHSSCILCSSDEDVLKRLKVNISEEPEFYSKELFYNK